MLRALLILLFATIAVAGEIPGGFEHEGYSVSVGQDRNNWKPVSSKDGYVHMTHMQKYEICLKSTFSGRCDAQVTIDGKSVGLFRINPERALVIEHPLNNKGRFTFIQKHTQHFRDATLEKIDEKKLGLITVTFYPEKGKFVKLVESPKFRNTKLKTKMIPGGTGLTGESRQVFVDAERIEVDAERAVTIHVRLVALAESPRRTSRETAIPPAVESPKRN